MEWQKPDGTAWNFTADTVTADITLTAQWTSPSPIDITAETGNNIVEKAVSYVNANGGSEYTLVLGESVSNVAPQTLDQDDTTLTITSDGNIERKISLGQNGMLFTLGSTHGLPCSAKLVIDGHITLEGKSDNSYPLLLVLTSCSLDLKGNAKITGNTSVIGSGITIVAIDVTITMSGNTEISGNTATDVNGGGGVYIGGSNVTFTMSDNATIKNNTATRGGGVFVLTNNIFIMNGGEISNNDSSGSGGGVYNTGTFSIVSEQVKANIHSNTAVSDLQVHNESTFTVGGVPAESF